MTRTDEERSRGEEPVEKGKAVINLVSFRSFFVILPGLKVVWVGDRRRDSISIGRGISQMEHGIIRSFGIEVYQIWEFHMNLNFKMINQGRQKIIHILFHCPMTLCVIPYAAK
jgi:hypothetical protein